MKLDSITTKAAQRPANLVQTIDRVDQLLSVLGKAPQGCSLGELAEKVNLPKGTTHRLIASLVFFDYVQQDAVTRVYKLGFKLVNLGNLLLDQIDIRNEARPYLLELAKKTRETVHLLVLDHEAALYIDKIQLSRNGLHMSSRLGHHVPLHCTAGGKVLLSHQPRERIDLIIRHQGLPKRTANTHSDERKFKSHLKDIKVAGYALDDEEHSDGIRCVAAPVLDMKGEVSAAVSVSAPTVRLTMSFASGLMKTLVVETARMISKQIGYTPLY